jgi:hypothetical protein
VSYRYIEPTRCPGNRAGGRCVRPHAANHRGHRGWEGGGARSPVDGYTGGGQVRVPQTRVSKNPHQAWRQFLSAVR